MTIVNITNYNKDRDEFGENSCQEKRKKKKRLDCTTLPYLNHEHPLKQEEGRVESDRNKDEGT